MNKTIVIFLSLFITVGALECLVADNFRSNGNLLRDALFITGFMTGIAINLFGSAFLAAKLTTRN